MRIVLKCSVLLAFLSAAFAPVYAQADCDPNFDQAANAQAYIDQGLYDQALAAANCVIQAAPEDDERYFLRGVVYFLQGDYDAALADLTRSYNRHPSDEVIAYYLGLTQFNQQKYEAAITSLTVALQIFPAEAGADAIIADSYTYRGARLPYVKFPRDPVK